MDPKMDAIQVCGLTVVPDFTFAGAPQPRIVIIRGAGARCRRIEVA